MEATAKSSPPPASDSGELILAADNVSKVFGGLVAVDGVTFGIPERSIVSIIGPNGAGKTTFFNMLTGVPDAVGLDFDVTSISFGIFGFLLVVMMVLRPEGLLPSRRRRLELHGVGTDPGEAIPSTVAGDEEWEVRRK